MNEHRAYGSPAAFRRALTDKLKAKAETSRWSLPQLQRQMAYDRLLERLYRADEGWIVKGAAALLARDLGVRATIDIDVFRNTVPGVAERELREAAAQDIGDWFDFETGPGQQAADGASGVRLPVTASIGPTAWAKFLVDVVGSDVRMTGEPEDVPALARVVMPQVEQHGYRAYPLVDHIAGWRPRSPAMAKRRLRQRGTRTSSTSWRSPSKPRWKRSPRRRRSRPRPSGEASPCQAASPFRIAISGSAATPLKQGGPSSRRHAHSMKRWSSSVLSSTRCSMAPRPAAGTPRLAGG